MATISFIVRSLRDVEGPLEFVPLVDSIELIEHVSRFEEESGMHPAGGYGGLVRAWAKFGPAEAHYLGGLGAIDGIEGRVRLLGCRCGEWGCWLLDARVVVESDTVTWTEFEQSHRPSRDYSAFGPFVFNRPEYEAAVQAIADLWRTER